MTDAGHPSPARGEAPAVRRLWLHFLLPWLLLQSGLDGLATWLDLHGSPLTGGAIALLLGWPLLWCLLAWGVWRTVVAARGSVALTQPPLGRAVTWVAAGLALTFTGADTALYAVPRVAHWWQYAQGQDSLDAARLSTSAEAHKALLQGPLALGDGQRVAQAIAATAPGTLLELQSPGGHRAEALAIAGALRARSGRTRVIGPCSNACVLVFLAGQDRQLMPEARLSLHRNAESSLNPLWRLLARRQQAEQWQQAGLPPLQVLKAMSASPAQAWQPEPQEWQAAGLLGVAGYPLDAALPPPQAPGTEWVEALRSNAVWLTMDQRFPGTLQSAAQAMHTASQAGTSNGALQAVAQQALQARVAELVREASIPLRELYARLQADRLAALGSADQPTCRRALAADPAVLRNLPAALREREAAWLAEAAAAPPEANGRRRLNALEHEVLQRTLGPRVPELLAGLGRPERTTAAVPGCALAGQLLNEVLSLPAAERRLALRLLYDPD